MAEVKNTPLLPSTSLLMKVGSIVVHTDEMLGPDGRELDKQVVLNLINDPEVQQWVKDMGAMLPVKRSS